MHNRCLKMTLLLCGMIVSFFAGAMEQNGTKSVPLLSLTVSNKNENEIALTDYGSDVVEEFSGRDPQAEKAILFAIYNRELSTVANPSLREHLSESNRPFSQCEILWYEKDIPGVAERMVRVCVLQRKTQQQDEEDKGAVVLVPLSYHYMRYKPATTMDNSFQGNFDRFEELVKLLKNPGTHFAPVEGADKDLCIDEWRMDDLDTVCATVGIADQMIQKTNDRALAWEHGKKSKTRQILRSKLFISGVVICVFAAVGAALYAWRSSRSHDSEELDGRRKSVASEIGAL